MKKNEALAVMEANIISGRLDVFKMTSRESVKAQLRIASSIDLGLKNAIFELGVEELAKVYTKGK